MLSGSLVDKKSLQLNKCSTFSSNFRRKEICVNKIASATRPRRLQILSYESKFTTAIFPQCFRYRITEFNSISFANFLQTTVRWDQEKCETELIKTFPETQIPPYFSYNGTVKIGSRLCEQWIWKTGGHNVGQPTSLSSYYISNQTNAEQKRYAEVSGDDADPVVPVMVETFYNSGPMGKTSSHLVLNITAFLIGEVDEELLDLPSFC